MGDEIFAFSEAVNESDDPEPHMQHRPFGRSETSGQLIGVAGIALTLPARFGPASAKRARLQLKTIYI
jgi:hypothetical protein